MCIKCHNFMQISTVILNFGILIQKSKAGSSGSAHVQAILSLILTMDLKFCVKDITNALVSIDWI